MERENMSVCQICLTVLKSSAIIFLVFVDFKKYVFGSMFRAHTTINLETDLEKKS